MRLVTVLLMQIAILDRTHKGLAEKDVILRAASPLTVRVLTVQVLITQVHPRAGDLNVVTEVDRMTQIATVETHRHIILSHLHISRAARLVAIPFHGCAKRERIPRTRDWPAH